MSSMALFQTLPLTPKSPLHNPHHFHNFSLPILPLTFPKIHLPTLAHSSPKPSLTEDEILKTIAESDGGELRHLPVVRTYENDLCRLTLVGAVGFEQAVTAAAADGGKAAEEYVRDGVDAMVVETVSPGPEDVDRSSVSTRLFLPARKVKEKAKQIKYFTEDNLSSTTLTNILAITFRQVVLQQLWKFELMVFRPGTERTMEDLGNSREVHESFMLSSSDEHAISVIAEVVNRCALENVERHFLDSSSGFSVRNIFHLFHKPEVFTASDSSVKLYKLLEDELVSNSKSLLEKFDSIKASYKGISKKIKVNWWPSSVYSKLEKIGGPEFSNWVREYVPAYRLEIDGGKLDISNFEGWKESVDNKWEVLLTHSQMVCLASILDMYYDDLFTLPNKQLSCGESTNLCKVAINKGSNSLLKMLLSTLISGFFVAFIGILGQHSLPHLHKVKKYLKGNNPIQSSPTDCIPDQSVESNKAVSSTNSKSIGWGC